MRVLYTIRFTLLRMSRNYIVLLLLLVVPMVLLTLFSFILAGSVTDEGVPYMKQPAVTMVFCFQLFAGSIVMSYIYEDFFRDRRMRIDLVPFNKTIYAFSIMMCGTVYSILLGVILMAFTQFVLGVGWDNWPWTIFLVALMSVLSSIICLIFTFSVKNFKIAERLSEVYGVGFIVLAGLFFPLPSNPFFDFMASYGNPLGLSTMSLDRMENGIVGEAWLHASILLAATGILFVLMLTLGRRRLQ